MTGRVTAAAQQLCAVAERTEQLARQHAALTEQLETAMRPYLEYVEWLERVGSGGAPDSSP